MDELLNEMDEPMRVRGLADNTREAYLRPVRKFGEFYERSPAELDLGDVESFLLHLCRDRGVQPGTRNQYAAGLRFFFGHTLGRREWVSSVPFARVPSRLPVVLSGGEVERLLGAFDSPTHSAIATLCYRDAVLRRGAALERGVRAACPGHRRRAAPAPHPPRQQGRQAPSAAPDTEAASHAARLLPRRAPRGAAAVPGPWQERATDPPRGVVRRAVQGRRRVRDRQDDQRAHPAAQLPAAQLRDALDRGRCGPARGAALAGPREHRA